MTKNIQYTDPAYRTPTADEHLDLPIQCVVRDSLQQEWEPALLVRITKNKIYPFITVPSNTPALDILNVETTANKYCRIRNKQPAPITRQASAESIVDPPPPTAPDPGEGYRLLKKSPPEPKQRHDWFWDKNRSVWSLVNSDGKQAEDIYYRRRIEPNISEKPDSCDELSKLEDLKQKLIKEKKKLETQEGYRLPLSGFGTEPTPVPASESTKPLQSHVAARFDCIDPVVLKLLAECLGYGAVTYSPFNYLLIPVNDHINHALNHINEHRRLSQETRIDPADEMHLVNALARITFAISCLAQQGNYPTTYTHPEQNK
jgi:hypothetical protein